MKVMVKKVTLQGRRIITRVLIIFSFSILAGILPVCAFGEDGQGDLQSGNENVASGIYDGVPWTITAEYELIIGEEGKSYSFDYRESREQDSYPWNAYRKNILKASFVGTINGNGSHDGMFSMCENMTEIDLSGFDTSEVTSFVRFFGFCYGLQSIDVSTFRTGKAVNMSDMFYSCRSLEELNLSNFDTSNVTNMQSMFSGCRALKSLEISRFKTSRVTSFESMFISCNSLTDLDVSGFDTSSATDMSCMFAFCKKLQELDVSSFDTSKVENMFAMFEGCNILTSLDVSGFKTENVTKMNCMFKGCWALQEIDVTGFDTTKVSNMTEMFQGCKSLKRLDLSNFNTRAVSRMEDFFTGCDALEVITLGSTSIFNETPPAATWQRYQTLEGDSVNIPVIDSISDYAGDYPGWYSTCTYEVTYNANGGTNAPQGQLKARGVDLKLTSSIPTRTGYTFSGWAETGDATAAAYQPGSLYKSDEATRFYAVWKKNQNSTTKPISITSAAVRTSVVYTGALRKPAVTVKAGSTVLKNGTDYTLTYTDNRNVGTAKVTVKGKGKYTGTLTKTFRITPYKLKAANVTVKKQATYTGKAIKPKVTVKAGETALKKGRDYTVTYTGNKNVGTATATVKGKGNYAAKISKTFRILPPKLTGNVKTGKVRGGKTQIDITLKSKPKCKVTEYVVQISASKKFPKGRIVVKPKLNSKKQLRMYGKLKKGKTFYIRVRIETKVKGKTYAGPWSNTMKFKGR